jgi:hypothetical protein
LVAFSDVKEGVVIHDGNIDGFSLAHFDVQDVFATGGIGRAELSVTQTPATKFFEGVYF